MTMRQSGRSTWRRVVRRGLFVGFTGSLALTGTALIAAPASAACFETADTGWVCTPDPGDIYSPPGQLPGATDPNDLIDDPTQVAPKLVDVANIELALDPTLATGITTPMPPDSALPESQPGGGGSSSPPSSAKVSVHGYAQGNEPWCVAAATATTLSAFGVTSSVSEVASAENWPGGSSGIPVGNAVKVLRSRDHGKNYYYLDYPQSSDQLLARAASDIWNLHAPMMVGAETAALHWWSSVPANKQGGHELTVYAYSYDSGGVVRVYDSAWNQTYQSNVPNEMEPANAANGYDVIW